MRLKSGVDGQAVPLPVDGSGQRRTHKESRRLREKFRLRFIIESKALLPVLFMAASSQAFFICRVAWLVHHADPC